MRGTAFACLASTSTCCGDLSSPAHVSFATRLTTSLSISIEGGSKVCLSPTTLEDCRVAFLLTGNPRACSHPGHPGDLCGLEGSYLLRLRLHGALPEQRVLARPFYFIFLPLSLVLVLLGLYFLALFAYPTSSISLAAWSGRRGSWPPAGSRIPITACRCLVHV